MACRLLKQPVPMKHISFSLLVALSACVDQPAVDTHAEPLAQTQDGTPVGPSYTNFCRTVTVTGSVFYNDLRTHGRFTLRAKPDGTDGTRESFGSGDNVNYLALRDAQVDIYEADLSYGSGASCFATALMGTTTVERDGTFSWTGQVCETCGADLDGGQNDDLSIAAKISLRNCDDANTRCFSVRDPNGAGVSNHFDDNWDGTTWSRWHAGASSTSPKRIGGTSANAGTDYFQATGNPTSQAARAANVFASMVDVTRKVHVQIGVPFGQPEVAAYFPNVIGGIAHSHESGRLCVTDPGSNAWIDGSEPIHEYGHLVHYWAWDDHGKWVSYCYDDNHDGIENNNECAESYSQEEYANAAFKEGWADFIAGVTLDGTGSSKGCDAMEADGNLLGCPGCVSETGRHFFRDVTRVLCDVWDEPGECVQRGNAVYCDNTDETLVTMVNDLEDVWAHANADDRREVETADENHPAIVSTFGICTLFDELGDSGISTTFKASGLDCGS